MQYLVSVAIGPVQDFISTARRTRDLWFGSWLLSELSASVARYIQAKGGELVFPADLGGNVVNKILATIPDVEGFEAGCRQALSDRLGKISDPLFSKLERRAGSNFYRQNAERQVADLTEFYWAAIPFDGKDYAGARKKVEMLLNARKSTRDFRQPSWSGAVPKSSLDGQRESVIDDRAIDSPETQRIFGLKKKERLCGVGVLKRLAENSASAGFLSTSHVAAIPFLATVKASDEAVQALRDYIAKLTELTFEIEDKDLRTIPESHAHPVFGRYDGQLLYENRLADLPFVDDDGLADAQEALKSFLKAMSPTGGGPSPYYAIVLADGDRMGQFIDGFSEIEDHRRVSMTLSLFSDRCREIVENQDHKGCLIYAGGDDVLALVPVHTVLDCARALADSFGDAFRNEFQDGDLPSLSVGVAVCHHTEPLQDALATARMAERIAKSFDPERKNSLAIVMSKRSGVDISIAGSWSSADGEPFDDRLKWLIHLHLDDALPDGVAYELRDLWNRFGSVSDMDDAVRNEAVRILKRKNAEQGLKPVDREILDKLAGLISSGRCSIKDLSSEIIIAADFAEAYRQSGRFSEEDDNSDA